MNERQRKTKGWWVWGLIVLMLMTIVPLTAFGNEAGYYELAKVEYVLRDEDNVLTKFDGWQDASGAPRVYEKRTDHDSVSYGINRVTLTGERSVIMHLSATNLGIAPGQTLLMETQYSWSAPPQSIRTGDVVRFEVKAEEVRRATHGTTWGAGGQFWITAYPNATGNGRHFGWDQDPSAYNIVLHTHQAPGTNDGTYVLERQIDQSGPGTSSLLVLVNPNQGRGGHFQVHYTYEWRTGTPSAAATPQPTPAPQPTPPPQPAPTAPATGGAASAESHKSGVRMEWPLQRDALGYRIFRSTNSNDLGISVTDFFITAIPFVDVNVEPNTEYHYTVKPVLAEARPLQGVSEQLGDPIATYTLRTGSNLISTTVTATPGTLQFIVLQIDNPMMVVNGVSAEVDPGRGTTPQVVSNRTMIPIRAVVEAMGGNVGWDGSQQRITLEAKGNLVEMWLNNRQLRANGASLSMDVAPISIGGRTFVPVRFAADNLDAQVDWINSTREVVIVY